MKKICIVALALVFSAAAQAQVKAKKTTPVVKDTTTTPVVTTSAPTTTTSSASKKKKGDTDPIKGLGTPPTDDQKTLDKFEKKIEKKIDKINKDKPAPPIKGM